MSVRDQFARVLVAQLLEIEGAALGDAQGFRQQLGRVDLGQCLARAQVAFAVGEQVCAGLGYRAVLADGGHAVLQGAAAAGVHVHVAAGHRRDALAFGEGEQLCETAGVVRAAMQFHAQPQAVREAFAQPGGVAIPLRQPEGEQAVQRLGEIGAQQAIAALVGAAAGVGDQATEVLVAG
ncbi:hypothetical protein D3C76_1014770 [compost metagenome]